MNITRHTAIIFATAIFLLASQAPARAQEQVDPLKSQKPGPDDMPGMPSLSPAGEDMNEMQHDAGSHPDAAQSAHEAMSGHHMDMNAHMFMTALRPENPADDARAAAIAVTVRNAMGADKRLHESRRGATKVKNAGAFAALSANRMTAVPERASRPEIEMSRLAELDTRG